MLTTATNRAHNISVTRCSFADLADLLSGAHVTPINGHHFASKSESFSWGMGGSWYGGLQTADEAKQLMRDGWQDGAQRATALAPSLANIVTPVKSVRRRATWGDNGNELHLDRALAGDWDKAYRTSTHTASGLPRVLSLGCNFGGNAGVSHESLFWCAAQMIVTADLLENAGYAVELRALKCNAIANGRRVFLDVLVKQPDQPVRADAIASVFGHAGVYRSFGHVLLMSSPFDIGSGYGSPSDVTPTLQALQSEGLTDSLDYVLEHAYDANTAAHNITRALTTLTDNSNE